jgi:ribosomal protein L11 methyltransferase
MEHYLHSIGPFVVLVMIQTCNVLQGTYAFQSIHMPAILPSTPFLLLPKHHHGRGLSSQRRSSHRWFSAVEDTSTTSAMDDWLSQYEKENEDEPQPDTAATLRSITFSNIGKDQEPQLLCNFLMELGACSTSLIDADRGTTHERAIFHENPTQFGGSFAEETLLQTFVPGHVWNTCHVSATFAASTDLQWIWEIVQESYPATLPDYRLQKVEDKDWVLHVQQSWKPIVLDPFVLKFPWHTKEMVQEAIQNHQKQEEGESSTLEPAKQQPWIELALQGGIAFGTGEHPTTQMCLEWITNLLSVVPSDDKTRPINLMDYGTGSGVLGIAACQLRPLSLTAVGVDIDVDAVHIANANAVENKVSMVSYLSDLVHHQQQQEQQHPTEQDAESKSVLMRALSSNAKQVAQVLPMEWNGPMYDICVANILAGPLVTLAQTLAGLVCSGGNLGLSGIMSSQSGMILTAYEPYFEEMSVARESGGWVLITGRRRNTL